MKVRHALVAAAAALALLPAAAEPAAPMTPERAVEACGAGYTHAALSWGHKCLREGQFCKVSGDREYHRYGLHCHTGARLSRRSTPNNGGTGCQPGYSPCLPRVADLNCGDIPSSKKPVRVTGDDPYRLDGDGDGIACEP